MGSPSVPYELLADGFKISSSRDGFRAQASFKVAWVDAFTFHDEIMGYATASVVGPVAFNTPWRFPGSSSARLYASSCEITPFALDGGAAPIGVAAGMAPGEFWSHARLEVTFETPVAPQSAADDPGNLNQINPDEPIYGCEQSIRFSSKSETIDKKDVKFSADNAHPGEDVTVHRGEAGITLHWQFVPFLGWKRFKPYFNKVNSTAIFDCAAGELLVQGVQIEPASGPQGIPGKSVTLELGVSDVGDWQKAARNANGTHATLVTNAGAAIYTAVEFRNMFLS